MIMPLGIVLITLLNSFSFTEKLYFVIKLGFSVYMTVLVNKQVYNLYIIDTYYELMLRSRLFPGLCASTNHTFM